MDTPVGRWACPNCWTVNEPEDARCRKCDKARPEPSKPGRTPRRWFIYVGATVLGIMVGWLIATLVIPDWSGQECSAILGLEPFPPTTWAIVGVFAVSTVVFWLRYRPIAWFLACAGITLVVAAAGAALTIAGCAIG